MKRKTCKACSTKLPEGLKPWVTWCSEDCGTKLAMKNLERDARNKERALGRERREFNAACRAKLKTRSDWLREAQIAFNAYIRERDKHLPCVACLKFTNLKWNAGHYRSVGSCPALRFEPLNCWKCCEPCNSYLSGNLIEYHKELLNRIGAEKLAWLEGPHEAKKYTVEDIIAIKAHYKFLLKSL